VSIFAGNSSGWPGGTGFPAGWLTPFLAGADRASAGRGPRRRPEKIIFESRETFTDDRLL
jgi:hypothetical protein